MPLPSHSVPLLQPLRIVLLLWQVYRGGWNGNIVAVKVIEYQEEVDEAGNPVGTVAHARNAIFEAVVSRFCHDSYTP